MPTAATLAADVSNGIWDHGWHSGPASEAYAGQLGGQQNHLYSLVEPLRPLLEHSVDVHPFDLAVLAALGLFVAD